MEAKARRCKITSPGNLRKTETVRKLIIRIGNFTWKVSDCEELVGFLAGG